MRVHELAKRLGLTSKELLRHLKTVGVEVKTHASSIEPAQVAKVENHLQGVRAKPAKAAAAPQKPSSPRAAESSHPPQAAGRPAAKAAPRRVPQHPGRPRSPGAPGKAGSATRGRGAVTDRKSRVERMFIQRKLARRQQAMPQPVKEPEPEITIQVIEEPEKPRRRPRKPSPVAPSPPGTTPGSELQAEAPAVPDVIPAGEEAATKKKGRRGRDRAPDEKKAPRGARRRGHREKGREKDETRDVITDGMEILKSPQPRRAPTPPAWPATRHVPGVFPRRRRLGVAGRGRKRKAIRLEQKKRREQQLLEEQKIREQESTIVTINEATTVADLAEGMRVPINELIAKLMELGIFAAKNQRLDRETIDIICHEYGFEVREGSLLDEGALFGGEEEERPEDLRPRPPVVTIMGHVDHGKTKLLDAVRDSNIVADEAGGITQHIGAYDVKLPAGRVVFLDTPGHEAFTAMRARGAMVTDVVVLVVAADDGVMPQTVEAIHHAKAAGVPIMVAVNKIDLPGAAIERVRAQMSEHNLMPEEWGGKVPFVEISALHRTGIDHLMEVLLLEAEVLELKGNPKARPRGTIIEAKLDPGRGPVATVLVQQGTLRIGNSFVTGVYSGKVRALVNDMGEYVEEAGPSTPVEVLGIDGVPVAGDPFMVVADERGARQLSLKLQQIARARELRKIKHVSLEDLHTQIIEGTIKELNLIVRADVQGSVGALCDALDKLPSDKVKTNVIHSGVGTVSESDVMLASASNALILGFNIRPNPGVLDLAKRESVNIHTYRVIYDAIADIRAALEGMLELKYKENALGRCQVREVFRADREWVIAGGYVTEGKLVRNVRMRILRDDVVIHEGKLDSLRRFKEDVKEVASGFECGVGVSRFNDVRVGDVIECFELEEVKQTLED